MVSWTGSSTHGNIAGRTMADTPLVRGVFSPEAEWGMLKLDIVVRNWHKQFAKKGAGGWECLEEKVVQVASYRK